MSSAGILKQKHFWQQNKTYGIHKRFPLRNPCGLKVCWFDLGWGLKWTSDMGPAWFQINGPLKGKPI